MAGEYPTQGEQAPRTGTEAVGLLVAATMAEVFGANDKHERLYGTFQEQAFAFAVGMRQSGGKPDVARYELVTPSTSRFGRDSITKHEVPIFLIQEHSRYGSKETDLRSPGIHRPHSEFVRSKIAITATAGQLVLVQPPVMHSPYENDRLRIKPDRFYAANDFINRDALDTPNGEEQIIRQWAQDLRDAAAHYAKKG